MPPTTAPSTQLMAIKKENNIKREPRSAGNSRESTPTMARPGTALVSKPTNDAQLATSFKSDLTNIRNLVTCSICDQLLYEPWTLGCGHTYCYSCLCSWFTTNRRKKTCPECRAKVLKVPAPNFLVKQMVDQVFTKRRELMPADESIEQHAERRAEEVAAVDKDRNGAEGLFKGLFPKLAELMLDEADGGILRCPGCGHEHLGGGTCAMCGLALADDEYGFSDDEIDEEGLADLELDLGIDAEVRAELHDRYHGHHHFAHPMLDAAAHVGHHHFAHHNHNHHHHHPGSQTPSESGSDDDDSLGSMDSEDDEDDESLDGFVVPDDDSPPRPAAPQAINLISDDESDEGGAISNRRPRHRVRAPRSPVRLGSQTPSESPEPYGLQYHGQDSPSRRQRSPSALTVTDTEASLSEAGMTQAELLRRSGWSPLDHGNDSDADVHPFSPIQHRRHQFNEYGPLDTDDEDDSDDSDAGTETATENGQYDEDDRSRDGFSQTPVPADHYQAHIQGGDFFDRFPYGPPIDPDYDSDGLSSSITDHDGDTNMTPASPRRDSRSVSANPYFNGRGGSIDYDNYGSQTPTGREQRCVSVSTAESSEMGGPYDGMYEDEEHTANRIRLQQEREHSELRNDRRGAQQLGADMRMNHAEPDSPDSDIRPPPGRRSRRPQAVARVQQQYNPRISMMFAEHQAVRGSQENPISFEDWEESEDEVRIIEPASRNRRMTAYRNMPARRIDPLRSSRSPSCNRVTSSAQRASGIPRQYSRRG